MKIGFIEPVYRQKKIGHNRHFKAFLDEVGGDILQWHTPNLGLLTTAALVPGDWRVKYLHSPVEEIDYDEPFDIVALSGMTCQAEDMYNISRNFRQKGVYTVIGGIHAMIFPGEAREHADTVIAGEAEDTFPRFIADYLDGKAQPLYSSPGATDITQSPVPRFDLLERNYGAYSIQTTRGCPHNCKFCAASRLFGKKYRHKTVDQVINEIKCLKSVKHNPFVVFSDDNMFMDRRFSLELLKKIAPLDIKWHALSDVSVGKDRDFLKRLYDAGCKELFIGFESIDPEKLRGINTSQWKQRQVPHYPEYIKNIRDNGIRIFGAFILGFDEDTPDDIAGIKDFVLTNKMLGQFTILTPVPGSQLHDEYKKAGRLLEDKSWKYYNFLDCVIQHDHFTPDQLEKAVADLYRATYSRENYGRVVGELIRAHKRLNNIDE